MTDTQSAETLVHVRHISKFFPVRSSFLPLLRGPVVRAVDDISFTIHKGETLGLVGESGCGKSTLGRLILRLYEPTSGSIQFEDNDVTSLRASELRKLRTRMQIVFQDSYSSLNPRHRIGQIIREPMQVHTDMTPRQMRERTEELLQLVGLRKNHGERFPHEFSGGQRQRVNIARALALYPQFVVCDEPISALDVSIQAQVVNLLQDLQRKLGITYLFVAHDLSMVQHISDRIAVMYLGKIMELAATEDLFRDPRHPYTQSLISAIPIPNPRRERERRRIVLEGEVPSPVNPPSGCVFHTRCPLAQEVCRQQVPEYREIEPGHFAACHFAHQAVNIDPDAGSGPAA